MVKLKKTIFSLISNAGHHFELTVYPNAYGKFPAFISTGGFGQHSSVPAASPRYTSFLEG